jgi:hypothetical protein
MRRLTILFIILAAASTTLAQEIAKPAIPVSEAKIAFEKLKTLAGSWEGKIFDMPLQVVIRETGLGTSLMHDLIGTFKPDNHEISMIYPEGERLLMTHFCDAGNRQHFEGKLTGDGKSVEFSLLEVVGGTRGGFLKRLKFTPIDASKHLIEATFVQPDGKPLELRGEFLRFE